MGERYTAKIDNDILDIFPERWEVEIKANSLKTLNTVVEQIRSLIHE